MLRPQPMFGLPVLTTTQLQPRGTTPMHTTTTHHDTPAALCAAVEAKPARARMRDHETRKSASDVTQPMKYAPTSVTYPTVDTLPPYRATPEVLATISVIVDLHRERQATIKAKTKIILQQKALIRNAICTEDDFEDDNTKADNTTDFGEQRRKLSKAAIKRVDDAVAAGKEDPTSPFGMMIAPYLAAVAVFEARNDALEKAMIKQAKKLPAFQWAKEVKGFGDVSFATIVGECGDIGSYKSIAAVWKRLGLAVMSGSRQGAPGAGATAQDWIDPRLQQGAPVCELERPSACDWRHG